MTKNPIFHKIKYLLSLVWRSWYQVGIYKSNTGPQLAEVVIVDGNSNEHPQNEVNQKELPQLKKYFTKSKECEVCFVSNINPLENILFWITSLVKAFT